MKNVGESVRFKLLQLSKQRGDDFQLLLTRFVNERLLFRLSCSRYASSFVLKGATLFIVWTRTLHRATRDVDLLGFGSPSVGRIYTVFRELLALESEDDGVEFDTDSLCIEPIRKGQDYGGLRALFDARVAHARVRVQVDVGFGDVVSPQATIVDLPTLLGFPAPRLQAYPRETVVAEKLEAMVKLGMANSRMKDFYDLLILSESFEFEGEILSNAIMATFQRRGTSLPRTLPIALTEVFASDKMKCTQWSAFLRKSRGSFSGSLEDVSLALSRFVEEPLAVLAAGEMVFAKRWSPGGPWS